MVIYNIIKTQNLFTSLSTIVQLNLYIGRTRLLNFLANSILPIWKYLEHKSVNRETYFDNTEHWIIWESDWFNFCMKNEHMAVFLKFKKHSQSYFSLIYSFYFFSRCLYFTNVGYIQYKINLWINNKLSWTIQYSSNWRFLCNNSIRIHDQYTQPIYCSTCQELWCVFALVKSFILQPIFMDRNPCNVLRKYYLG